MKVYIKGLNICPHRRKNLLHYKLFLEKNSHEVVPVLADSDTILVWTCGFRKDVIENSIFELLKYRDNYKGKVIAVGCLPDIDRVLLENRFKGIIVPWKKEAKFFEEYFSAPVGSFAACTPVFCENTICPDAAEYRRLNSEADAVFHDQFFKVLISEGCPLECTYCTEKLAYPPFRSVKEDDLVKACRQAVEKNGEKRIMLIADCLGRYGSDISSSLPILIRRLHSACPDTVYAFNNFHPKHFLNFYEDMKQFLSDGWIAHINLPIQSASDKIISAMNRQYTREELDKVFGLFKETNFKFFDTHIIVGFPGETDEDFMETIDFLRQYKPAYALVSKYYDAPTALSYKMKNKIDDETINRRLKLIESAMKELQMVYNIDGAGFMQDRLRRINIEVSKDR
ncbi:MAG: radical SAM protein [Mobilitalea sp.]